MHHRIHKPKKSISRAHKRGVTQPPCGTWWTHHDANLDSAHDSSIPPFQLNCPPCPPTAASKSMCSSCSLVFRLGVQWSAAARFLFPSTMSDWLPGTALVLGPTTPGHPAPETDTLAIFGMPSSSGIYNTSSRRAGRDGVAIVLTHTGKRAGGWKDRKGRKVTIHEEKNNIARFTPIVGTRTVRTSRCLSN